jgi:hypothetical protein
MAPRFRPEIGQAPQFPAGSLFRRRNGSLEGQRYKVLLTNRSAEPQLLFARNE